MSVEVELLDREGGTVLARLPVDLIAVGESGSPRRYRVGKGSVGLASGQAAWVRLVDIEAPCEPFAISEGSPI